MTILRQPLRLTWLASLAGIAVSVAVLLLAVRDVHHLRDASVVTGWALFALMVGLAAFNARKRLSMLPLGKASTWLLIHVIGGVAALIVFWLHTGRLWPLGHYEQALTILFYLVSASGIFGYCIQRIYPPMLTTTGEEIIYERIPFEIANLRAQAEAIVLNCTRETGHDTLARHFLETLAWYFRRPRFFWSHVLVGKQAEAWQRQQFGIARRYLSDAEHKFLDQLAALAAYKHDVDFHYAAQSMMKGWLMFHVPIAVSVMALAIWHIILVHIYVL